MTAYSQKSEIDRLTALPACRDWMQLYLSRFNAPRDWGAAAIERGYSTLPAWLRFAAECARTDGELSVARRCLDRFAGGPAPKLEQYRQLYREMTGRGGERPRKPAGIPTFTADEASRVAKEGKIPVHASWRDRVKAGTASWDGILTAAALASFTIDQQALDDRIRRFV
jgi:hypothetical protein